ncbi:MAG: hypothetical protein QOD92_1217 [Acidimicrobiaceae bacterium]|jgi:hypothetical protein
MSRVVRALLLVMGISLLTAACSSDSKKTETSGGGALSTAPAPEELRASAADVVTGLKQIDSTAKQIASTAGTDKTKAKELVGEIEPVWETIEGTVKANDPDSYIAFEDAFALLETAADDGDATKAQQAAGSVSSTVTAYLAKYPG